MITRRMSAMLVLSLLGAGAMACVVEAQPGLSARAQGMGGAFVAISDDANANLYNPAGLMRLQRAQASVSYSKLYAGLPGDNLHEASITGALPAAPWGSVGAEIDFWRGEMVQEFRGQASYARRLWAGSDSRYLTVGAGLGFISRSLNSANFVGSTINDPVLAKGLSTFGITSVLGMLWSPRQSWVVGLSARNLNQPNMVLESGADSREPLDVRVGVANYVTPTILATLEAEWLNESIDGTLPVTFRGGVEATLFDRLLQVRAGATNRTVTLGLGLRAITKTVIGFDYAFVYPLGALSGEATTHKFSVSYQMPKSKHTSVDITVGDEQVSLTPTQPLQGDAMQLQARIGNDGGEYAFDFPVSLYRVDADGGQSLLGTKWIAKLAPDDQQTLTWTLPKATSVGEFRYAVSADDSGHHNGAIAEYDEENNVGVGGFIVYAPVKVAVDVSPAELGLSRVTTTLQDKPLVPIVFFDADSVAPKSRYAATLKEIARRLERNPGVRLRVLGYYHPETEALEGAATGQALALSRAQRVKALLVQMMPDLASRIEVITTGYDPSRRRAEQTLDLGWQKGKRWIGEENRRVELEAALDHPWSRDLAALDATPEKALALTPIDELKRVLADNPEVDLAVIGYHTTLAADQRPLQVAGPIRTALQSTLAMPTRVMLFTDHAEGRVLGDVSLELSAEALLHRPILGERIITEEKVEPTEFAHITATVQGGKSPQTPTARVLGEDGHLVRAITMERTASGAYAATWDWRDTSGAVVPPDVPLHVLVATSDTLGQRDSARSSTMQVKLNDVRESYESTVVVQFVFAALQSESRALESRIEYVARKILDHPPRDGQHLEVEIAGHTDITGVRAGNERLSETRAEHELSNVRNYLKYLLSMASEADLDAWLDGRRTALTARGYADDHPFVAYAARERTSTLESVTLGDNTYPEGRAINRRVEVAFRYK